MNIITHSRYNQFKLLVLKLTYNEERFSLLNLIQINSTSVEVRAIRQSGVSKGFSQICISHAYFLKSDDHRSTCRALSAFKSVGVSSDTSTFCFPQGGTPERENYENIRRKKVFNHWRRKSLH